MKKAKARKVSNSVIPETKLVIPESDKTTKAWNKIPWGKIQRKIFKLQKRIYQAAKSGQQAKARRLQKLLLKSYYAKLLATRKVTQDNQGKNTAGIDGVKSVKPQDRFKLAEKLGKIPKAKPLRRVWIPKPGRTEKRPLGIPTIQDRAEQALVKMALEPAWESRFEGTSYGFRPARSPHDAIGRIYNCINQGNYYVLDADIAKCFDQINHDYLLSKLQCSTTIRRKVKQWLKAGVLDNGVFDETEAGTPQGGVISPLLANIALDGMARHIKERFPGKYKSSKPEITLIRYADDFVAISKSLEVIEQCKIAISEWLKPIGLKLKPEKTKICHTLNEIELTGEKVPPGFNFLGFNIRQYPVGKHKSGKSGGNNSKLLGFATNIKPSKEAIKAHTEKVKEVIRKHRTSPQAALIKELNPIIIGWSQYYSGVVSMETFNKLDHIIWQQLRAWTVSRCGKADYKSLRNYFRTGTVKIGNRRVRSSNWLFQTEKGHRLERHDWTQIVRHKLVKPDASPYDGNWIYWATRKGTELGTPKRVATLLKRQQGQCTICNQYFTNSDQLEIDHIQPISHGGKDEYANLQLLHRHCHDLKTANDGSQQINQRH